MLLCTVIMCDAAHTHVKNGEPPSIVGSRTRAGGRRYISTSVPRANWGMRVSSFVETSTVRAIEGSTCGEALCDGALCLNMMYNKGVH